MYIGYTPLIFCRTVQSRFSLVGIEKNYWAMTEVGVRDIRSVGRNSWFCGSIIDYTRWVVDLRGVVDEC